jgi:transposase
VARYGQKVKERAVARLLPPESSAVEAVSQTVGISVTNEGARSAWCREHGVYPIELENWKLDAIGGLGEPRETESVALKQERRRNKELERELHRKDKTLGETAAFGHNAWRR